MGTNIVKRELYQEAYFNYTGKHFNGKDKDLYKIIDEYEMNYSSTDYP